jgi:hypothetical protein
MLRHILVVGFGILLTYLLLAAGGFALYKIALSTGWPDFKLGMIVRYGIDPAIAVVVGAVVGLLAKNAPAVLAAISLIPWALLSIFSNRLDSRHRVIILLLSLLYVAIGAATAKYVLRVRTRGKQTV